ncbi:MAG: DUF5085 family protein [Lachnospiraceae bacterium]|nr:DUF5085 family protein [Lachnospiraceae bacterium]
MNTKYIYKNDKMTYQHVYSKSYLGKIEEFKNMIEDFAESMVIIGAEQNGNIFYSIKDVTEVGVTLMEIFMPAKSFVEYDDEDIMYSSYFYMDDMLSKIIERPEQGEASWAAISLYQQSKGIKRRSEFYHELHLRNDKKPYILLKTK